MLRLPHPRAGSEPDGSPWKAPSPYRSPPLEFKCPISGLTASIQPLQASASSATRRPEDTPAGCPRRAPPRGGVTGAFSERDRRQA